MLKKLNLKILLIFTVALTTGFGLSIPITIFLFNNPITQSIQDDFAMRSALISDVFSRLKPEERDSY